MSIVSTQHFVNIARQRALQFGTTVIIGPDAQADASTNQSQVHRNDLVVTSTASQEQVSHKKTASTTFEDFFREKPRGLFADQFEVSFLIMSINTAHAVDFTHRTWQTTRLIITALVQKFGVRLMEVSMFSLREQVQVGPLRVLLVSSKRQVRR